jgi:hypothetical protein
MSQRSRRTSDPTRPYFVELIKSFVALIMPLLFNKLVQLFIDNVFSSNIPLVADAYILISDIAGLLIFIILNIIVIKSWIDILRDDWKR